MRRSKHVSLRSLFLGLQEQMIATHTTNHRAIAHPGTKGDAAEVHWLKMLQDYLPARYCATRAFVLDSNGNLSQQIDIVIYDVNTLHFCSIRITLATFPPKVSTLFSRSSRALTSHISDTLLKRPDLCVDSIGQAL